MLPTERCPICGAKDTFKVTGRIDDVPYFGETMETLMTCDSCRFRHADVLHLEKHEPTRYYFSISSEDDMMVRVVRSSTGTIKVPELHVTVKPGPASEGYVSNIEGVLERIEGAIKIAIARTDPTRRRRGEAKLKKLDDIRRGKAKATIIIVDPFGNSAIADKRARKQVLTEKDAAKL